MDVKIGDRWKPLLGEAIEPGRFAPVDDVIKEGLSLVADQEARFQALKAKIDASIIRGGEVPHDTLWSELHASVDTVLAARAA